jgi:hypothetical protein
MTFLYTQRVWKNMKSICESCFHDCETTSFMRSLANVNSGSMKWHLGSCDITRRKHGGPRQGKGCVGLKPPTSVTQVRSFLGFVGYYRRFIPNFSKISKPITKLLKKGIKYVWSKDCDEAFQTLKKLLTTTPVLAQPDIAKSFDIYCDASGTGLGCVLTKEG